jgi:lauroyl/myristoyl acyltransferase
LQRLTFGLQGLDDYRDFFGTLRQLPYPIVHRFLVELREHELQAGERRRWAEEHAQELEILRLATGSADGLESVRERYLHYRLLQRPIAFTMLTLFSDNQDFMNECVVIEGREILDENPGAVLCGTHFGPQTALPFLITSTGRNVTTVVVEEERSLASRLLEMYNPHVASRISLIGIPDHGVLVKCMAKIRGGEPVLVFMEFNESDLPSKTQASFLGMTIPVPEGPFFLAATAGRPLIPVYALHEDDLRVRMVVQEPIHVPRVPRSRLGGVIQEAWSDLEQRVRRFPEQWLGWEVVAKRFGPDAAAAAASAGQPQWTPN